MKVTIKQGTIPEVKPSKEITQLLVKKANFIWQKAIRAGLEAIVESDIITVDTGMSKSSLIPLARAVRFASVFESSINPKRLWRLGSTTLSGIWEPGIRRTAAAGEEAGEGAFTYKIATRSELRWHASFKIPVYQYLLHETGKSKGGTGPWNSLDIFLDGVIDYLQEQFDKDAFLPKELPDLFYFEGTSR